MIVSIEKDDTDVISAPQIKYVLVSGYIYEAPMIIEIGSFEYLIKEDSLIVGEKYKAITRYGTSIDIVLSEIDPNTNTISGKNYTAYKFMHEESYNLFHNLYHPTHKVFGISLKNYIIGSKHQFKIALLELRKKGLHLALDKDFKIVQKQVKEYETVDHNYILELQNIQKIHTKSSRQNYSSIEGSGDTAATKKGDDSPKYLPNITKNEIKGLNLFISPKFIAHSTHENGHLLLGEEVTLKQIKYCVIEKSTIFIKNDVASIITLGSLK